MSRESDEMAEEQHMAQFDPDPGINERGFYPGEEKYLDTHPERDYRKTSFNKDFGTVQPFAPLPALVGNPPTSRTSGKANQ